MKSRGQKNTFPKRVRHSDTNQSMQAKIKNIYWRSTSGILSIPQTIHLCIPATTIPFRHFALNQEPTATFTVTVLLPFPCCVSKTTAFTQREKRPKPNSEFTAYVQHEHERGLTGSGWSIHSELDTKIRGVIMLDSWGFAFNLSLKQHRNCAL